MTLDAGSELAVYDRDEQDSAESYGRAFWQNALPRDATIDRAPIDELINTR